MGLLITTFSFTFLSSFLDQRRFVMNSKVLSLGVLVPFFTLGMSHWPCALAEENEHGHDYDALIKVLPGSKHSLADGIRQAAQPPEVAISAKFELGDDGKLALSVYIAGNGLGKDAEHNVLKELGGSPESDKWTPETEIFEDKAHVARSAQQLALMAQTKLSLRDVIARAEKAHKGTVFSIKPEIENGAAKFEVLLAEEGKVVGLYYDLFTGVELADASAASGADIAAAVRIGAGKDCGCKECSAAGCKPCHGKNCFFCVAKSLVTKECGCGACDAKGCKMCGPGCDVCKFHLEPLAK